MVVGGATGHERGRVVADDGQDREAQRGAGVLVGAVPHLACGLGPGSGVQTHPLGLDALAGEGVHGARCGEQTGRAHHQVVAHLGTDLDDLPAGIEADAVDADGDAVAGADHAQVAGSPAEQRPRRRDRVLDVGGGDHLLRGGREPHAVHDRVAEPGEPGRDGVGVDGVAVAGDRSESAHVTGRGDGGLTQQLAGGLLFGVGGTAGADRIGEFG